MRPSEAQKILENPEDHTVQERKDAKEVMAKVGSLGQDKTTPLKRSKGGDTPGKKKGKVPVIAISVGMAEMPKNGNPRDNRPKNLALKTQAKNRSYPRTRTAGKRNPYA